jgi:phosphoesterase RecJ-like protein
LSSFELHAGGRLAVIRLTREALTRCGATREMTEDLINEPQRLGSVVACVLLVEPEGPGPVRVSFRSKRGVDVAALAAHFGGGGHERAAGARIAGTMDEVARRVIEEMIEAL